MTTSRKNSRLSLLTAAFGVFVALAAAGSGKALAAGSSRPNRGAVTTRGPSEKVVVVGPAVIHAYSEFRGGTIYAARAVTGTDADCRLSAPLSATNATNVDADRIATFTVGQGQVACLATQTRGSFELLWHAVARPSGGSVESVQAKN